MLHFIPANTKRWVPNTNGQSESSLCFNTGLQVTYLSRICLVPIQLLAIKYKKTFINELYIPTNMIRWPNVDLLLAVAQQHNNFGPTSHVCLDIYTERCSSHMIQYTWYHGIRNYLGGFILTCTWCTCQHWYNVSCLLWFTLTSAILSLLIGVTNPSVFRTSTSSEIAMDDLLLVILPKLET